MTSIPAPDGRAYAVFQEKGIRFALGGRGTLIADEMGLGKTVEAIGVINATGAMTVLVVAPAGLILNWKNELDDWLVPIPGQSIELATYHQVKSKLADPAGWDILIIDEIHYCKNPKSKRSITLSELALKAKRVIGLTGTPIENSPIELWPLLRIICPEKWDPPNPRIQTILPEQRESHPGEGPNFWAFAKRYCNLHKRRIRMPGGTFKTAYDFSGASHLDELQARLRKTCMVRRLKTDVLTELPEKRRQLILLPSKGDNLLSDTAITEGNYFDVLRRLKADKVLFEEYAKKRHDQALAKTDDCLRFIGDQLDASRKIIVFAHHSDVIEKLRIGIDCEFHGENAYSVVVTGKTPMKARQEAVDAFQNDELCRVFIGSIGAAGTGFTLTAASHVIFVELDPVPGRMNQAEDRAHRMTQRNMVLVQHLLANNSLCARIAKILIRKQSVIAKALDTNRHDCQSQDSALAAWETFRFSEEVGA